MTTLVQSNYDVDENPELHNAFKRYSHFLPGIADALTVPQLDADSLTQEEFIRDWVSRNRACLVKGAVRSWPAGKKWKNKEYWKIACDNFEITAYPHENYNNPELQNRGQVKLPFHDAIDRLFSGNDRIFSMPSEPIRDSNRFAALRADIGKFKFMPTPKPPRFYEPFRFFSYKRASTAWHYHIVDETLMCQVVGSKRVILLSSDIKNAGYISDYLANERYLESVQFDPSIKLTPLVVDVNEGDALYIPPYWHHVVVPNDGTVGFTLACCWQSPIHILGKFSNYFVRSLYKRGFSRIGIITIILPAIGLYAGAAYTIRKLMGRAW